MDLPHVPNPPACQFLERVSCGHITDTGQLSKRYREEPRVLFKSEMVHSRVPTSLPNLKPNLRTTAWLDPLDRFDQLRRQFRALERPADTPHEEILQGHDHADGG